MSNFFKRTHDDDYDHFHSGSFSKELRQSINAEDRIISAKDFLVGMSRFVAVFVIVFSVALTGYWIWRENTGSVVDTTATGTVTSQQETAATTSGATATGVTSGNSQPATAGAVTADESTIAETGADFTEITLWMAAVALIFFACLATTSHRLLHNLINT